MFRLGRRGGVPGCGPYVCRLPVLAARSLGGTPQLTTSGEVIFFNAPEGCRHGTHIHGTAYIRGPTREYTHTNIIYCISIFLPLQRALPLCNALQQRVRGLCALCASRASELRTLRHPPSTPSLRARTAMPAPTLHQCLRDGILAHPQMSSRGTHRVQRHGGLLELLLLGWLGSVAPPMGLYLICRADGLRRLLRRLHSAASKQVRGLSGTVPSEFGLLTALKTLDLGHNSLSGTMPPQLGNLALEYI